MTEGVRSLARHLAVALVTTGAALLARLPLWPALGAAHPFLTFYPAVALAGYRGGWLAGLLATALGALAASLIEPAAGGLVGFALGGVLLSLLAEALQRARRRARAGAAEARRLL